MTVLAWGAKVSREFRDKIRDIAAEVETSPSWLMAAMAFETGRTFSPSVKNPGSSATGLIQFMETTAASLGTSTEALARMTALEQLDYVLAYFRPFKGRLGTLADVYMAILWPAAVGQPDDYPVFQDKRSAYAANRGLDIDHDGVVTKRECVAFVEKLLAEGLEVGNCAFEEIQPAAPIEDRTLTEVTPSTGRAPQPESPKETAMPLPLLAIVSAITTWGPTIAALIPQVATLFDKKEQTPAKLEAAQAVVQKIVETTGAINTEAAIGAVTSDAAMLEKVRAAVVTAPEIMPYLVVEVGGGFEAARKANEAMMPAGTPPWQNPALWVTLLLILFPLLLVIDVFYVHPTLYSGELRTQIVTGVLGVIFVVSGYWLGGSIGSARKTDIMAAQQGAAK
jgi:hypothetical protein